jgi:hypothetical protein
MKNALWLLEKLYGRRIEGETRRELSQIAGLRTRASRGRATGLLERLAEEEVPRVLLGRTAWEQPVEVPLEYLTNAHAVITGGTGSGKTMAALLIVEALLELDEPEVSFGVLDAKGELFERTLCLIYGRLAQLPAAEAEALRKRVVIVDLACPDPLSSYNVACPWQGSDLDFFATSRVDTFLELLPSGDGLSLRGSSIVKHALLLLAEHRLPFSHFDRVLSSEVFRTELLGRSKSDDLKHYFRFHFPNENRATIAAVRARLASSLFSCESLKLALSGETAPDFRMLQDEGKIVLINCAGPTISRTTARTLQALFLSDIRQAVFARHNRRPYLWVCDEAQNFFRTRQLRENMTDLLTMSRSFGSFFLYLTQNLTTAVQEREMLETLYTNIRWSFSMRGTSRDGAFLEPAFPISGRREKPRSNPYAPREYYSPREERAILLEDLTHLPDRVGWLWLKSLTGEAIRLTTAPLHLPRGDAFTATVNRLRKDPSLGGRLARAKYLALIEQRDAELAPKEPETLETLKQSFRRERRTGE